MKKISLSLKITVAFTFISILTLVFLYFVFFNLFEQQMLKVETEKAILIAQTIEPMIGMSNYLGMKDEITSLAQEITKREQIIGLKIIINNQEIWNKPYVESIEHIHINYPVKDPVSLLPIGYIDLSYTMDTFNKAINDVQQTILYYLGLLAVAFIAFALLSRHTLRPLSQIASRVQNYIPGKKIDFSNIRLEPETDAITTAFDRMVSNIREHTTLLERYKHSVDESSIVNTLDLNGNITYVNDEFCRVCGYTKNELVGQHHNIVQHPDTPDSVYEDILSTLKSNEIWKSTLKNKRKDGSSYYVKSTIVPIVDDHGKAIEYISIQHDITQIIEQQEQILRQTTDATTGLPNRIKLEEDKKTISSAKFAILNIDNYNIIKDYYGYDAAFKALKDVTGILQNFLDNHKITIYKLAAGEFGLLVGDTMDVDFFKLICQHLIQKIEEHTVHISDDFFDFTASAGLTSNSGYLLTYAALALKHAQETKKSVILYEETENLIQHYENNILWTKKLKLALNENRIAVFIQSIHNTKTLKIDKYECLVRMIDVDGKIISPFFFLDIAKQSKLYHLITQQVIEISFENFSKIPDIEFSVNFSVEDILHPETVNSLINKLQTYDIASRFVIEIVESEGIESFAEVADFISQMKAIGCKIAIDDFGTGYSNFSYLMQLNVDIIKIDGSLIKTIDHDKNSQIISNTIYNFSRQLNLTTVAEFVHNEAVLTYVQDMGIDYVQGFHLAEPVPINTLFES